MIRRLLLGLVALVLVLLAGAAPAAAHTELVSSDPANESLIATAPTQVTLTFNEAPLPDGMAVVATQLDGPRVELGAPQISGASVIVTWPAAASSGVYTVAYRVVADDGHPVTGQITFTIGSESPTPEPAPTTTSPTTAAPSPTSASPAPTTSSPTPTRSPSPSGSSTGGSSSGGSLPWLAIGVGVAVIVLVALVVGILVSRRQNRS